MSLSVEEMKAGLSDAKKFGAEDGMLLIDALVGAEVAKSKGEARRLIQQGSISVNGEKTTDLEMKLNQSEAVNEEFTILKKGKKNYFVITF